MIMHSALYNSDGMMFSVWCETITQASIMDKKNTTCIDWRGDLIGMLFLVY